MEFGSEKIVVGIDARESTAILSIDIGVNLRVQITNTSQNRLNISLGDEVYVTFKASSVRVF